MSPNSTPKQAKDPLEKHRDHIAQYREEQSKYDTLAKKLKIILKSVANDYDPLAVVMSRSKGISSFAEKIIKKNKYNNPLKEVTDLAGARIIVHFPKQVEKVCKFIRDNFDIDEVNSFDHRNNLKIGEFGYRSVHYIISPNRERIKGEKIPDDIRNLKAEIQVRTFLEHNWADIGHDRLYKTNIKVPKEWNREAARLAAIMENAEQEFTAMAHTLDTFATGFRMNYTPDSIKTEIDKLEALVKLENDPKIKFLNIFRLCNVFAIQGAWQEIISLKNKYLKNHKNTQLKVRIKGEYYRAELMLLRETENKKEKEKENTLAFSRTIRNLILTAQTLEEISLYGNLEDPFSVGFAAAKIYFYIGQALSRVPSRVNEARTYFNKAHQLVPDDPYFFNRAVVFDILNCQEATAKNMLQLLTPQLKHAVNQCFTHLEIGANGALAYSTMGRIYILLGWHSPAINAYAKSIDLILRRETLISDEYFREEIKMLNALGNKVDPELSKHIQLLISLALWIKDKDSIAGDYLEQTFEFEKMKKEPFKKSVLLVAGGAAKLAEEKVDTYEIYVKEALWDFEGTVISGGTKIGIPGLVGKVTKELLDNKSKKYDLFGYLPDEQLPKDAEVDENYGDNIYHTNGKGFSVLELLNYWYDIRKSGILPSEVFVLGINGGKISDLEYKLALAFGARVGVISSSGRAVADLMLDNVWNDHPNLMPIPDDKYTVWALVNHSKPTLIFTETKINEMAQTIHEKYRQMAFNNKKLYDDNTDINVFKSLIEWKYLDRKLKHSNKHQALLLEHMLKKVNLTITPKSNQAKKKKDDIEPLPEELAQIEHGRWCAERLMAGWRYAPKKDISRKLSPYLVPWKNLPEDIIDQDKKAVNTFPEILNLAGFEIQPIKKKVQ